MDLPAGSLSRVVGVAKSVPVTLTGRCRGGKALTLPDSPHMTARAAAPVALVLLVLGASVRAAPPAQLSPGQQMFRAYLADPVGNRAALLELARHGLDGLPRPVLLALTDAYLRQGQPRAARAALQAFSGPDEDMVNAGLAWIAFLSGDLTEARTRYTRLAAQGTDPMATVIAGLLDAAEGRTAEAVQVLDGVAANPETPARLREVAALGTGYAHFWARNYSGAEQAFTTMAEQYPGSRLTDDARYGAALARYRRGDVEGAAAALQELTGPDAGPARASRDLQNLRPGAILRAGRRHYARAPFLVPAEALAAVLDVNGVTLARAALRRVEAKNEPAPTGTPAAGMHPGRDARAAVEEAPRTLQGAPSTHGASTPPSRRPDAPGRDGAPPVTEAPAPGWQRPAILAVLIAVIAAFLWQRRGRSGAASR